MLLSRLMLERKQNHTERFAIPASARVAPSGRDQLTNPVPSTPDRTEGLGGESPYPLYT